MALRFPTKWRFTPPDDGEYYNRTLPPDAVENFISIIHKTSTQGDATSIIEHFKKHFCIACGSGYWPSSSHSWAESDLHRDANEAAQNAPLFIEAFYDACETLRRKHVSYFVPDTEFINHICKENGVGYEIREQELVLRETISDEVSVPERPPTVAEEAWTVMQKSVRRADELLADGRGREAVQELLWVLESLTTAFRGIEAGDTTVRGRYFNRIVGELRRCQPGSVFDRVLDWVSSLHGYLSSPSGGGVRHGIDLQHLNELSLNEARLFCNLIRSYVSFLVGEHERLVAGKRNR